MKGRPKGSVNHAQFKNYVTEKERLDFALWVAKNYKKNPKLAIWYGDQIFGKAVQPIGNDGDKPLLLQFDGTFTTSAPKGDS